ncbi:MAG: universal stress protein [Haloplanus sp.]
MYDTILVPIDGSDGANRAIQHALDQADQFDATLHSIFVVDTRLHGEPALSSAELVLDDIEDRGQELLHQLSNEAADRGVEAVTRCCHGTPHAEIIDYGDDIDADVIILGYRGQTHTRSDNIGSVAERVVRHAGRPVLVV